MPYSCATCGKLFANRHSKWRHQKKYCRGSEISELKRAIEDLKSLMVQGGNSVMTITNNVTTTINNHVTINQYNCEDIDHIQHDTIRAFNKRHDLNASLRKLIEMIHFDRERPQNHNVYLQNVDAEHAFCMGGQNWEKKETRELAKEVIGNAAILMENHKEYLYDQEYT